MTTHYMEEAEWCDRIAIIDHGTIVALGSPDELKAQVGGDIVVVSTADNARAVDEIAGRLGATALVDGDRLRIEVADGVGIRARSWSRRSRWPVTQRHGATPEPRRRLPQAHRPRHPRGGGRGTGRHDARVRDAPRGALMATRTAPALTPRPPSRR